MVHVSAIPSFLVSLLPTFQRLGQLNGCSLPAHLLTLQKKKKWDKIFVLLQNEYFGESSGPWTTVIINDRLQQQKTATTEVVWDIYSKRLKKI